MGRLEAVTAANARQALAYLAQRPYENVYVHWLLATGAIAAGAELVLWRDGAGVVRGMCHYGAHVLPAADDDDAIEAFASHVRRAPGARMIAGSRRTIEGFWKTARRSFSKPAAIRVSQPVYAIAREALRYTRADADVALATLEELDDIAANSALMIAGEVGGDIRRTNAAFRNRTARIVEAGWWWRSRIDGRLAFMCNIGSAMPQTAQVHGVWTPPAMRGRGHAARALGAICDHLLEQWPTVSLYVNAYNAPAIALYERVGFTRVGEFQTILFS